MVKNREFCALSNSGIVTRNRYSLLFWLAFLAFATWLISFAWIGFLVSDDYRYIIGANGWLNEAGFLPSNHWEVRHPLTLPLAVNIAIFGVRETSVVVVSLAYFAGVCVIGYTFIRAQFSSLAAKLFLVMYVSMPMSLEFSGLLNVDIVEIFWCLLSIRLFVSFSESEKRSNQRLIIAGMAAGLAFFSRETSVGILIGYGVFFLHGKHMPRRAYFIMAAGFLGVMFAEFFYFYMVNGNPFHRYDVLFLEHSVPNEGVGNFITIKYLEPFAALFINHEFGLLFWFSVPALAILCRGSEIGQRGIWILLGTIIGLQYALVGYGLGLRSLPRYYGLIAFFASMVVGVAFAQMWQRNLMQKKVVASMAGVLIASNIIFLDLSNKQPILALQTFVDVTQENPNLKIVSNHFVCQRSFSLAYLQTLVWTDWSVTDCEDITKGDVLVLWSNKKSDTKIRLNDGQLIQLSEAQQQGRVFFVNQPKHTYTGLVLKTLNLSRHLELPDRLFHASLPVYVIDLRPKANLEPFTVQN